jgi:mannose-6-phosphate isomerase-like protein (cupin superfamily)
MNRYLVLPAVAIGLVAAVAYAQPAPTRAAQAPSTAREDGLDPTPVNPAVDVNVEMFVNDWRNSPPRNEYGRVVFRDILTQLGNADPLRPTKKGAVLQYMKAISYATLVPGATATGRGKAGDRQVFYTTTGSGKITVAGKAHDLKEGVGFTLTPGFDFVLANTGKAPLGFYVRTEALPDNFQVTPDIVVVNRFDGDRRVGAHWAHICNGGPNGFNLCTIAPRTIPQPHSHPGEEIWIAVKGETILTLGKHMAKMVPGQAYRIPPTGVAAHSNINLGDEPVQLLFVGPAQRAATPANPPRADFAQLDGRAYNRATEQDVDMFMGAWRDAFPRVMHGNLYFRDMLTALQGPDPLHPTRKGAVLTNAEAVSYVQLEPGATAHKIDGELKGVQQTFVVNSGAGVITSGSQRVELQKDMAFIITPGLDFKLTATGDPYMSFYVVSEKIPVGVTPRNTLQVVDNRAKPQVTNAWYNKERPLVTKGEGLSQYNALTQVELKSMAMSRPYSNAAGSEEIWIATEGDIDMLFGKELRRLPAGTAYRVPATGITAHANINASEKPARFLYMVK